MLYISYYTEPHDVRISSPAANAKTISISKALQSNGIDVEVYSTCTTASKFGFIPGRRFSIGEKIKCRQIGFFSTKSKMLKRIQYRLANIRTFFKLLFTVKKGENVIFYHATERARPILLAKKFKKFRLILEVEEIYANSWHFPEKKAKKERRFFESADAFIFPTEMLNSNVNISNKPYTIIHGTYEVEPVLNAPPDDKIHIVYAGTLDPTKGGARVAVDIAKHLSSKYHMHILGFGNDELVDDIRKRISDVQAETECAVSYDGCLLGDDYKKFIQGCHIGLSTQNPNEKFNDTSFPSKILSYMANGLSVVTVKIPVVETSAVNEYVNYSEEFSSKSFADTITGIDFANRQDGRKWIQSLNTGFIKDILTVL